ncbi:AP-1-like transcription factor [Leucoagaricus sp. SymC.cos]|nr:AP-1-like transcription factor [Leucoagaricus sp. SymC.cos]
MDASYPNVSSFWDLSQLANFGQLPDDDFMAMLQKQFPLPTGQQDRSQNNHPFAAGGIPDGVNPQNISRYSPSSLTPPSEDSSPSPPHDSFNHEPNGEDSGGGGGAAHGSPAATPKTDSALKRKASGVDMQDDGPSQKNQHTLSNDKKGAPSTSSGSRRKSTGNTVKDESRLLKRKEQNRAAQRAFRERKEKHVKDLEDKVAELEAKNEASQHENENLRDLLSRLQSENIMLKQTNFTFTMAPKSQPEPLAPRHFSPESSIFSASPPSSVISPEASHITPKPTNPLDWTSLASFDPSVLNLLDESPQTTATSSAMNLDLFSSNTDLASGSPFTMIASNPTFMSFASSFDTITPLDNQPGLGNGNGSRSNGQPFSFDVSSMSSWPTPTPPTQDASLDDLFAGYLNSNQNASFSSPFASTPSISPIAHQATINIGNFANLNNSHLNSLLQQKELPNASRTSSIPSPSSQSTASSDPSLNTPKEISAAGSPEADHKGDSSLDPVHHDKSQCPKTKTELVQKIAEAGASPFAPVGLQQSTDVNIGPIVSCAGSAFPKTAKSDKNVEVLSAWRSITSNPKFRDANIDINDLCSEFTSKAKCDGTKVVLEPEEMHNIIEALANKKQ